MSTVKVKIRRSQLSSVVGATMLAIGLMAGAIAPYLATAQTQAPAPALPNTTANTSFPDTQNYWAQPFIHALAQRNIVTGYPDNTFRPAQTVGRDEFAAILRQAFDKAPVRQIRSGSAYTDVPEGYWASAAIKEAYEMGFMDGYPGGQFRPKQPVTKVQVLTALARKLNLPATTAATTTPAAQQPSTTATTTPATQQPANIRTQKPMMFPLAMLTLMQPFMTTPARAIAAVNPATASSTPPAPNGKIAISEYYQDAAQIPQDAVDAVAKTTAAGIVVNYPNRQVLNPNQAATRGEVSALIHQALVYQGKITPLPTNPATNYIVGR